jgi:hypothetical protein
MKLLFFILIPRITWNFNSWLMLKQAQCISLLIILIIFILESLNVLMQFCTILKGTLKDIIAAIVENRLW